MSRIYGSKHINRPDAWQPSHTEIWPDGSFWHIISANLHAVQTVIRDFLGARKDPHPRHISTIRAGSSSCFGEINGPMWGGEFRETARATDGISNAERLQRRRPTLAALFPRRRRHLMLAGRGTQRPGCDSQAPYKTAFAEIPSFQGALSPPPPPPNPLPESRLSEPGDDYRKTGPMATVAEGERGPEPRDKQRR
ncbi:hypothetical protein AAFF_G00217430 [Aldrovandia affinis]|uniref:Uncharacterized protein n=1 Tax=Aldrovandia affinis TaxID=143900 RepID=A0AAD7SVQ6_9TELE|nr:hypothetical protein AAFF_G00217430 [Aldrovandia affinis]